MQKKIPQRTCVVSKEKYPKNELVRVVRNPEGVVIVDLTGRANGRGAYLKCDHDILLKARKTKVLERHLEVNIPDAIYEQLMEIIDNK